MTTFIAVVGIWLGSAATIAIRLGQMIRGPQLKWRCPDDLGGLMRELEGSR